MTTIQEYLNSLNINHEDIQEYLETIPEAAFINTVRDVSQKRKIRTISFGPPTKSRQKLYKVTVVAYPVYDKVLVDSAQSKMFVELIKEIRSTTELPLLQIKDLIKNKTPFLIDGSISEESLKGIESKWKGLGCKLKIEENKP